MHKMYGRFFMVGSILLLCLTGDLQAQTITDWEEKEQEWQQQAVDAYKFPVRPGTPEWAQFKTGAEMVAACQVPEEILKTISTAGLVETYMNYPCSSRVMSSRDLLKDFEDFLSRFNGGREIIERDDAGVVLVERYKAMDPEKERQQLREGRIFTPYFVRFPSIELLMAHDAILSTMPRETKIDLLQETVRIFHAMQRSEHLGSIASTVFVMAKILESEHYQPLRQQIEQIQKEDVETIRQRILRNRPDLKGADFTPIPKTGVEKYQAFLRTGGGHHSPEITNAILLNAEKYLTAIKQEENL